MGRAVPLTSYQLTTTRRTAWLERSASHAITSPVCHLYSVSAPHPYRRQLPPLPRSASLTARSFCAARRVSLAVAFPLARSFAIASHFLSHALRRSHPGQAITQPRSRVLA